MGHLTAQEQSVRGLEYLALAHYYFHGKSEVDGPRRRRKRRRKDQSAPVDQSFARVHDGRMTSTLLSELMYSLHGDSSLKQKPTSRDRQMRFHVEALYSQFPDLERDHSNTFGTVPFQKTACSYYLVDYKLRALPGFTLNDSAIESYVLSVGLRNAASLELECSLALVELVVLRYAIQHKLRLEIKIREGSSRFLRCYAVGLETRGQQLCLVVFEPERQAYRRFALTDVQIVNPDLWKMWQSSPRSTEEYSMADAEKQLRKDETRATLVMSFEYYPRFLKHLMAPVDVLSRSPHVIKLQVRGMSTIDVEQLLYPHLDHVDVEPRALKDQIYANLAKKAKRNSG